MKATYIGTDDPSDDEICEVYGRVFAKGKALSVTEEIGKKLAHNPTFKVSGVKDEPEEA